MFDTHTETLHGQDLSELETATDNTDARQAICDDPQREDFLSDQEIADQCGASEATIKEFVERNKLLGYKGIGNNWLIPRAQFVPGIDQVVSWFEGNHRQAWFFLSSNLFYGDEQPRPIDRLQALHRGDREALEKCLAELERAKCSHDHGDHF